MTIFYLDIECDNLQGTTLLQVACISQHNKIFNAFCSIEHSLPEFCTNLTGFHTYNSRLFQHGTELKTIPKKQVLSLFTKWISKNSDTDTHILAHNGYGYDYRILLRHYQDSGLSFHPGTHFCDTLPSFKKLYKLHSLALTSLAEHFCINNLSAHNALSDSIVLKQVCDKATVFSELDRTFFIQKSKKQSDFFLK